MNRSALLARQHFFYVRLKKEQEKCYRSSEVISLVCDDATLKYFSYGYHTKLSLNYLLRDPPVFFLCISNMMYYICNIFHKP